MQGRLAELEGSGLGLAAISYDPVETLAAFSAQHGITFPLLSDSGSETIRKFGLLNTVVKTALGPEKDDPAIQSEIRTLVSPGGAKPFMAGMAFPGTFLLERGRRVTARYFEDAYAERTTASSVLIAAGAAGVPVDALRVSGAHLDLTAYPSDAAVAPGNRFSLVVDLKPSPGIHIYAPGAKGYRAISFTVAPEPHIRLSPVRYPVPQTYFFQPLNERVPVFQKPFTIVEDVVLESTREAQRALREKASITLTGTLDYQACDDKQCFNPASVPLHWTLALRPLVAPPPKPAK